MNLTLKDINVTPCESIQAAKGVGLKIQLRRHSWVQIPSLAPGFYLIVSFCTYPGYEEQALYHTMR